MKFDELIHELECDYGRINFRERLMLRRAYDVVPEKEETDLVCHKVDKWDSEHRFYAYGNLSDKTWKIEESKKGNSTGYPYVGWFKTREDAVYYLKNCLNKKGE